MMSSFLFDGIKENAVFIPPSLAKKRYNFKIKILVSNPLTALLAVLDIYIATIIFKPLTHPHVILVSVVTGKKTKRGAADRTVPIEK